MDEKNQSLRSVVNASGFLLQLRIEKELEATRGSHKWRVVAREHHWANPESGTDGYIDLILSNDAGNGRLVIECKRSLDTSWVFLVPRDSSQTETTRCFWTSGHAKNAEIMMGWDDLVVHPKSLEAAFCVVRGQCDKDKPMLERVAGILLDSVESLGVEGLQIANQSEFPTAIVYLPAIVTTAALQICRFEPGDINIATGQLSNPHFEPVDIVRFRKGFSTRFHTRQLPRDLTGANRENERSVFVIGASHLATVLETLDIELLGEWPWKAARNRANLKPST